MTDKNTNRSHDNLPPSRWRLYVIRRIDDDRLYVGITSRTLESRFRAHIYDAQRGGGARGRPGTLAHAMRSAVTAGLDPKSQFRPLTLRYFADTDAARRAEAMWIRKLRTSIPHGFNMMPGGSSVGSIANAKPLTVEHPIDGVTIYPTVSTAVAACNDRREKDGRARLPYGVVYARLAAGWSAEESLGYRPHLDGRSIRSDVRAKGRRFSTLQAASAATGVSIDTLRSRAHRARRAGLRRSDLGRDRRLAGSPRAARTRILLPHPLEPAAAAVNAAEFARLTDLPRATVLDRARRLRFIAIDPISSPRKKVLAALMQRTERRSVVELRVPDGRIFRGGIRAVIRMVLGNPRLKWRREELLGESAIRARLRTPRGSDIEWAFGFGSMQSDEEKT